MKVADAVRTCALEMLDTDPSVSTNSIVRCAKARFPECFEDEGERLAESAARRLASVLMKSLSEDEDAEQMSLPDFALPTAIAVPTADGDYEYVRTDKATWSQLCAGRSLREMNVERAQAKLRRYDRTLGALEPVMVDHPEMTTAEAMRILLGGVA